MDTMDELKQKAQDFMRQVAERDFSGASRLFDNNLTQALPEARLKETWLQLIGQAGSFQKVLVCQAFERGDNRLVTVSCQFEKFSLDFHLVINQNGQIAGLNYQPSQAGSPYTPPAYVHAGAFKEVEVTIGSGEWACRVS